MDTRITHDLLTKFAPNLVDEPDGWNKFLDSDQRTEALIQLDKQWITLLSDPVPNKHELIGNRVAMAYLHNQYPPDLEILADLVDFEVIQNSGIQKLVPSN